MKGDVDTKSAERPLRQQMKGFTLTAESYGFNPDLLWSGLRVGQQSVEGYPVRLSAATAGRVLPSIRPRKAPPPVEI